MTMRLAIAVCLISLAVPALADEPAPTPPAPPAPEAGATDVEADRLLDEGGRLFAEEADYDAAMQRFQESYRLRPSWKALNGMALVFQQQGRLVEAIEAYEQLLREFGATLTAGQLANVQRRLADLEKRVGVLVLDVPQEGARVAVDGRELAKGPYQGRVRLLPGEHQIVGTLEGHQTFDERVTILPGGETAVAVVLETERVKVVVQDRPTRQVRRWSATLPYKVISVGVGLGLVGLGMQAWAQSDFDEFDAQVDASSVIDPITMTRMPGTGDTSLRTAGKIKAGTGAAFYGMAGAAVVGGCVMIILNRQRTEFVGEPSPGGGVSFAPLLGDGVVGASVSLRY